MGYKSEQFTKPVDENLFCSICHEVFQDPVSCKDGHTFCSECIEQWLKTSKSCPLDNGAITDNKLPRNYIVKGIIDNLEVYCYSEDEKDETKNDGTQAEGGAVVEEKCSWTGKLQELVKHRGDCGFQLVHCKHPNCTVKEQRRRIKDHMAKCEYQMIVCASCRVILLQREKKLHVEEYCPKTIIRCPNLCVNEKGRLTTIRRMDVDEHLSTVCVKALVDCPFMDQGCSIQVERQHVEKHVQDNMAAHMMLLAKENKQLKQELHSVKESLKKSKGSYVWITKELGEELIEEVVKEPSKDAKYYISTYRYESPVFLECGYKWKLFLYLKRNGFIEFYLVWFGDDNRSKTRRQDKSIAAFVRLSILSNTPEKPHRFVTQCHTFTKANDTLKFRDFFTITDADFPAYHEGGLKVECSIQLCYSDD